MARDNKVFLMGEEVAFYHGAYKVSQGLLEEFGENRVIDTPITEEGFTGVGIGAAMMGLRPVIELMTFNFSILALDQIINHAAKIRYMSGGQFKIPIVIRGPGGAAYQLAAQHSQVFESYFCYCPGLKVVMPATPKDAKGLLKSAIRDDNPVIFIESEILYNTKGEVPDGEYLIPLGKAEILGEGDDITIISYSKMLLVAEEAVKTLRQDGISVELINLRTLKPLDNELITSSVQKTGRVVIVEEGWEFAGLGAQIADTIYSQVFDYLDGPVERVTSIDVPMPYAANLEKAVLPDREKVIAAARRLL
ncbi:MAG: pyruvate dehydrogenase complex E1 component subunit beta [Candidatus Omnitrophica bacterium]|nr:pyruvate dehydrogenase complex E1 component subunit beta [Candidatus Omnitrophota bacterium]